MAGNFRDELLNGVRNAFCTALEVQSNYYGWVAQGPFPTANLGKAAVDTAHRLFCDREPPDPPEPAYTGGQCYANYNILIGYHYTQPATGASVAASRTLGPTPGPVTDVHLGYRADPGDGSDFGFGAYVTNRDGAGFIAFLPGVTPGYNDPTSTDYIVLSRPDGLPDNCGNPPPPVPTPEPGYNDRDVNITYTNNEGDDITIPVNFIFAPVRVNLKGELTVPVRIDVGGVDIKFGGDINLNNSELEINFGNNNYNRNGLPNPDGYQTPDDAPDVPPDVPDDIPNPSANDANDDTTRILRACIVTVTNVGSSVSEIFQSDNPNIYAPNLGYINFGIVVGTVIAWTSDIPVKNKRNFILCPWDGGATKVAGTPRPGVTWTITPVYANVEDVVEFS